MQRSSGVPPLHLQPVCACMRSTGLVSSTSVGKVYNYTAQLAHQPLQFSFSFSAQMDQHNLLDSGVQIKLVVQQVNIAFCSYLPSAARP